MIPDIEMLTTVLEEVEIPTNTHKIILEKDRVSGYIDGLAAMRQAVYLILNTERYAFPIYSWNYGIELQDLFGQQMTYVIPTVRERIIEALMQDDRITDVSNFQFETNGKRLHVQCVVTTIFGNIDAELEVRI